VSFLTLTASTFDSRSRLMLIAPHPDDEALACSVILQQAVRAGAAIRIVYVTDGDNNPWPQRVIERRWRLSAADRKRWGKLRRAEALAALRVLDINPADVQFLALPDQGLTDLLLRDCDSALTRLTQVIDDWSPTDILAPSLSDIHPDHNAVAVMMRLIFADFLTPGVSQWNYLVRFSTAPPNYHHPKWRLPQNATQFAVIKRKSNCRGYVFLDMPRARNVFFVSNAIALSGAMEPFNPFFEHATTSMSIFALRPIGFVCRGASFSFWVATRLGEHARARFVFPAARPILRSWIARRMAALASPVTGAIHLPASLRFHCICFRRSTICSSKSIGVRGSSMRPVGSRFRVCRV